MEKKYLMSTNYEIDSLSNFEKKVASHLSDSSKIFNYDELIKNTKFFKKKILLNQKNTVKD